jgi:hypothetical protein
LLGAATAAKGTMRSTVSKVAHVPASGVDMATLTVSRSGSLVRVNVKSSR